ncbi:MAG: YbjN domain-containing protein [Gemmatimonadota bacterium]|mgnify:CR=1 FL=1|nr:YbjN domain-containing protein [Gemmatimonadota bacterium]
MVTKEDIQSFIDRLESNGLSSNEVEPDLWVVKTAEGTEVVINLAPPVVIFRVRVMEVPTAEKASGALFRKLLELNARDLVHGSYGLEGDHILLTDTLELEHLDSSEFQASFDSITLALASHMGQLSALRERSTDGAL